jgi:hypothetical protein
MNNSKNNSLAIGGINNLHQIADFRLIGEAVDSDYEVAQQHLNNSSTT